MNPLDRYVQAATRDNTRRSYRAAIEHFEVTWGGVLPTTADQLARYLADHAGTLSLNTLRQRLAALAQWHQDQGFVDPTKAPLVKKVLKGIAELHPAQEKRAKPLQLEQLEVVIRWIETQLAEALTAGDSAGVLTHSRNKALVLLGFWRGFRSDELRRLQIEYVEVSPGQGMTIFLPRSKTDRNRVGRTFKAPALSRLCPVAAYQDWVENAGLIEGPVFRRIDRWGRVGQKPLHRDSITALLRELFRQAGIPEPDRYSSHSLRRGFAAWANANRWDVKSLMEYVGWKDVYSALRYLDSPDPFAQRRIEQDLNQTRIIRPTLPEIDRMK
jgi:integrase